jgi:hypothetical protein
MTTKNFELSLAHLRELEPVETICILSAYQLQPENSEKQAMIEFAIRLAASHCHGSKRPTLTELHSFIQSVGEFYKHYSTKGIPSLESVFSSQFLFSNYVEGNLDQTIDSLWKRFEKHEKFLEKKIGFNVANAILFVSGILSRITLKMEKTKPPKPKRLKKSERYDFAFFVQPKERIVKSWSDAILFGPEEIESLFPSRVVARVKKYIVFASVLASNLPEISDPLEANPLLKTPIIKFQDKFLIPVPYYLMHGLSSRLNDEISKDQRYKGKYGHDKGKVLEERASEELRLIFRSGQMFRNVKYKSFGSKPDADIIISYDKYLIFVECTTKGIPQSSRMGDPASVTDTLAKSIEKCYLQALRAKKAFTDGRLKLKLAKKPSQLLLMIVTDSLFPNLISEFVLARRFGADSYLSHLIKDKEYPYIISITDLESLRHVADERFFMEFILERLGMYEKPYFIAYDELDYFILFSKPEYKEIKKKVIQSEVTLNYVAHLPSPVINPHTFHILLNTIGADDFVILKIGDRYDKMLVTIGFNLLYHLYCDWEIAKKHFVFNAKEFSSLVKEYREKGMKCRAIFWEGFYEYLKFCQETGRYQEIRDIKQKLKDGSIRNDLNVLIVIPTDIYNDPRLRFRAKHT